MNKLLSIFKKYVLFEREVICITHCGIKSKKIGTLFLVWNILAVLWAFFATIQYFGLRNEIMLKEYEIANLKTSKQRLLSDLTLIEKNVHNIKNFMNSLNKYDRFNTLEDEIDFSKTYSDGSKNVNFVLNRLNDNLKNVNNIIISRIKGLENIKNKVNIDDNIKKVSFDKNYNGNVNKDIDQNIVASIVLKKTLDDNIEYLESLETFINNVPFSEPMQSNYVTSKFGTRLDPFVKTPRVHHGVDLVGAYLAKIHAPAPGKVIFVGEKMGYGKVIIIEHENDIKTLYGHLNSYNVEKGDVVKRGDIIAVQGNTGRSTGSHLHYEILRGKNRYNPIDFIKIGSNFY